MGSETAVLIATAITIGFMHTILGPDHYLPFIMLSKARQWSAFKTALVTIVCGIGHVLSSIALGFVGIALGTAVWKLEAVESFRGGLAAWLLLVFGFTYFVWGAHRAIRNRPHKHLHEHENGDVHLHTHTHTEEHTHVHSKSSRSLTPWILFTIFIFGPCEPLIPLIMYPAAQGSITLVILVAFAFGLTTVGTMLGVVMASYFGLSKISFAGVAKYSHALAGLVIFLCGVSIKFLGL